MIKFTIQAEMDNTRARAGIIETPHGKIETPAFIPVATKATIKSLTPEQVRSLNADAILANTYHLYLQPGTEVIKKAGGLGKFMNWSGPTFTDSGGFQAFSLGDAWGKNIGKIVDGEEVSVNLISDEKIGRMAKVDDDGVTFKSIIDGSIHRLTPETSIEIQQDIGADIIFAFDECISPHESYERQKKAVERTKLWAERCLMFHKRKGVVAESDALPALFGIIQGGRYEDLRLESARAIGAMDFEGFGIGGSFDKEDIGKVVGLVCDKLPKNKPRHLLGIGSEPADLIFGIENGIDTFDCVAPTRIARNGTAYTINGRINLLNAKFTSDFTAIDLRCNCYTCQNYTKAYVAHLFRAKEMLAATLTSIHNLFFLVNLVKDARTAIVEGKFEMYKERFKI
ncbi:MAG: tRNA guanosine(34) transglycosylase Tgt [Patescibacteria group bacterium]